MAKDTLNMELYFDDINCFSSFDSDKNMELLKELNDLKQQLDSILNRFLDDSIKKTWIEDRINCFLNTSNDVDLLCEVKKIYDQYIFLRDKVISGNLKLVVLIVNKFFLGKENYCEDIIQYGNIGLMRAIEKFDINMGIKFSAYASIWISGFVRHNLRNFLWPLKIPMYVFNDYVNLKKDYNNLCLDKCKEISLVEFSSILDVPINRLQDIFNAFDDCVYLDEPMNKSSGDYEYTYKDFLEDDSVDIEGQLIARDTNNQLVKLVNKYLTERQSFVILNYYGFFGKTYNLYELASMMGISFQAVSSLKERAIKTLRKKQDVFMKNNIVEC